MLVLALAAAWLLVSVVAGFPARWEIIFQTVVSALTLAMVFVLQHNSLVTLEHASDDELHAIGHDQLSTRQAELGDETVQNPAPGGLRC
ncbi:MAG TPA: hypothetical protein VK817_08840 [Trebonia sp.]|jgi:hypothetical protein|nr:hypothetical protein [Trebonia sp.]